MSDYDVGLAACVGQFSGRFFFSGTTAAAPAWGTELEFTDTVHAEFVSWGIIVKNDSVNTIEFSFDGENVHGAARASEEITFDNRREKSIWVRSAAGGDAVRVFAW